MKYEISLSDDGSYLHIRLFQSITAELERIFAEEAINAARGKGILRYFADVRGIKNVADPAEKYVLANEEMKHFGLDPASRVAVLISPGDHSHDFIETVFRNAGFNFRLFKDEGEALDWLKK